MINIKLRFCVLFFMWWWIMSSTQALDIVTLEKSTHAGILKRKAQEIHFPLTHEDSCLIAGMKEKLFQLGGVGLAAPQVNQDKQIVAIYIPEEAALLRGHVKEYPMHILINPSYQALNPEEQVEDFEACYSVSSKAGKVPRFKQIQLRFYDEQGKFHESIEEGFYARVLQHEIDHLQGILIVDRLTADCIQGTIEEMMAMRRKELTTQQKALFDELMKKKFKQ
nr:peptide deformylase [Legionella jordanis]